VGSPPRDEPSRRLPRLGRQEHLLRILPGPKVTSAFAMLLHRRSRHRAIRKASLPEYPKRCDRERSEMRSITTEGA
jgi:hypothetical protein